MSAHTPGPWKVEYDGSVRTERDNWLVVRQPATTQSHFQGPEKMANARLIAAAPRMLAALKSIIEAAEFASLDQSSPLTADDPEIDEARAAIALAKGET